jgi:hypothetical protein
MGTVFVAKSKQADKRSLLRADVNKALWREIHAVAVLRKAGEDIGGPLALNNLDGTSDFGLWVGALIPTNSAKIVDVMEGSYPLPAAMLQSTVRECYEKGVQFAARADSQLGRAISLYRLVLESNESGLSRYIQRQARLKKTEREKHKLIAAGAQMEFWTEAERSVFLLRNAVTSEDRPSDPQSWGRSEWGKAIHRAARNAYELACPRATARQMQAFVMGLSALPLNP